MSIRFNLISRFLCTIELSDDPDDRFSGGIPMKKVLAWVSFRATALLQT